MSEAESLSNELQRAVELYETAKSDVATVLDGLSDEQANWRPHDDAWSILECIDHLNQVGVKMIPPMHAEMEKGRAAGKTGSGPFKYSWLGRKFAKAAGPLDDSNTFKGKSPKLYVPGSTLSKDEISGTFLQLQDDLIALTREAEGLHLKKIKVTSPAIALVRFSLGVWLNMLPAHQIRHLRQAQDVRDKLPST